MPEAPEGSLGGLDVGCRLFLPFGTVELQDGLQRDFADPVLDRELRLVAVLLLVFAGANLADELQVSAFLERGSKAASLPQAAARCQWVRDS